jgi:hypothetical protein
MTTGWQNLSRYKKREGRGVGAVSLQVVLSGLRMVAIFLVMLAGRG